MTLALEIPTASPSLNEIGLGRESRWKYRQITQRWRRKVIDAYYDARVKSGRFPGQRFWPIPPHTRVRVQIERISPGPLLDDDNFRGGLKPVLDALKAIRLIDDDNPGAIDVEAIQTLKTGAGRWTLITLTDARMLQL